MCGFFFVFTCVIEATCLGQLSHRKHSSVRRHRFLSSCAKPLPTSLPAMASSSSTSSDVWGHLALDDSHRTWVEWRLVYSSEQTKKKPSLCSTQCLIEMSWNIWADLNGFSHFKQKSVRCLLVSASSMWIFARFLSFQRLTILWDYILTLWCWLDKTKQSENVILW